MSSPLEVIDQDMVQVLAQLYQDAAQELLHAYQSHKEATSLNQRRAFRAALHHARLSCSHSSAAHAHLMSALAHYTRLAAGDVLLDQADEQGPAIVS